MAQFDLPLDQLEQFKPDFPEPADFDSFWQRTLAATPGSVDARFTQLTDPFYKLVDVYDVTYRGFGGQPIKGWFVEPAGNTQKLPTLVQYVGYGGGRSLPLDHLQATIAGFAFFVMDTRGQGSNWSPGDTADDAPSGPAYDGFMTRGIMSPDTYYYRRVYTDAVRAVDAVAAHPHVDPNRIGVMGGSQAGGITIAVAGLLRDRVKIMMPDVPFLCHFKRGATLYDSRPYAEISAYLKCHRNHDEQVFQTLNYFDGVHLAKRATAPALFSVGLMDTICPPSTVYAAYNHLGSKTKKMSVYPFNNHEGGGIFHAEERLRFALEHL